MILPDKTIERLSQYRRNLLITLAGGKEFIFFTRNSSPATYHFSAGKARYHVDWI